ncbi:MAG: hypothetical protein ACQEP9_05820 [Bacillota bacterium]
MQIEYFQSGMCLGGQVDFSISKSKLQEDLQELIAKGVDIEIRPFNWQLSDLINKKILKVEYWQSAYNNHKIVLVSRDGGRLIVGG